MKSFQAHWEGHTSNSFAPTCVGQWKHVNRNNKKQRDGFRAWQIEVKEDQKKVVSEINAVTDEKEEKKIEGTTSNIVAITHEIIATSSLVLLP